MSETGIPSICLEYVLTFLNHASLAICEQVCHSWSKFISDNHCWRTLSLRQFKAVNNGKSFKTDSQRVSFFNGLWFKNDLSDSGLPIFDYLDYVQSKNVNPWKRLYLIFSYLFSCKPGWYSYKYWLHVANKLEEKYEYESPTFYYNKFEAICEVALEQIFKQFAMECQPPHFEAVLFEYIKTCLQMYEEPPRFELGIVIKAIKQLAELKKQTGFKITKDGTHPISELYHSIMRSDDADEKRKYICHAMDKYFTCFLEEKYATELFTELFNAEGERDRRVIRRRLGMLGAPTIVQEMLRYSYYGGVVTEETIEYEEPTEEKELPYYDDAYGLTHNMTMKFGGTQAMAHILLGKEIPQHCVYSLDVISSLEQVLKTQSKLGPQLWALFQITKDKDLYEFWTSTTEARKAVTDFLIAALTLNITEYNPDEHCGNNWFVCRLAHRIIVHLGKKQEFPLEYLQARLEEILHKFDPSTLPLEDVTVDGKDISYYWALLILVELNLGDKEELQKLSQAVFIQVQDLDPQLRSDILKYYAPYARDGMHPRWLIEASTKGIEYDEEDPYWVFDGLRDEPIIPESSRRLQKDIVDAIGESLKHVGFLHCSDKFEPVRGVGTYSGLTVQCRDDKFCKLLLSEVGPYAKIIPPLEGRDSYLPKSIDANPVINDMDITDAMEMLTKIVHECGVRLIGYESAESRISLTEKHFRTELGEVGNICWMPHTVDSLLFFFTD